MQTDAETQLYERYVATALYAISNGRKMTKTLDDIERSVNMPHETRDGKQVADAVAKRIGIKIDWGR